MKCVLCKLCEVNLEIFWEKHFAWRDAQMNNVAIMEREADPSEIYQAHDLLKIDPAVAFKEFLALAESGSIWSMATVGHLLENGIGTARDLRQAEEWYLRAYQAGSDYALIQLGLLYQESSQHEKAQDVLRTGVARGLVPALYYLAWSYWKSGDLLQRRDEALALLNRGSVAGDFLAKKFLANSMMRGLFGLRYVPAGIRMLFDVFAVVAENGKATQSEKEIRSGLISRLAAKIIAIGRGPTTAFAAETYRPPSAT